ncbi:unnamed protein product [Urochloa humidicola]
MSSAAAVAPARDYRTVSLLCVPFLPASMNQGPIDQNQVPEYAWMAHKVFHLLNLPVNGVQRIMFVLRCTVQLIGPEICLGSSSRRTHFWCCSGQRFIIRSFATTMPSCCDIKENRGRKIILLRA